MIVRNGTKWTREAFALAAALRIALLIWGQHQDSTQAVKYTDVDYYVFSDAARCLVSPSSPGCDVAQGSLVSRLGWTSLGDPYARSTYRYTPLVSLLLAPNILFHPMFGKCIFALADLGVAVLHLRMLELQGVHDEARIKIVSAVWLLNPIIANISTRGSSESVLGLVVVACLLLAQTRRWDAAAVLLGFAVHLKLYPVIYAASILANLAEPRRWINGRSVRFALLSFAAFMLPNLICFALWGWPFLDQTFLYHLRRLDHRHNFSPYFYALYLATTSPPASIPTSRFLTAIRHPLTSFVPQLGLALGLGLRHGRRDLAFAWFAQTFAFVTFNKVCTSQYFLWYLWLLPPVLPRLMRGLSVRRGSGLLILWVLAQAVWLSQAFRLEMLAKPVFRQVWLASVGFLVVNVWILGEVITAFDRGTEVGSPTRQAVHLKED